MAGHGGPDLVQDGLVLSLDAASKNSYPGSGTTWTDLSPNGNDGTITNATFSTAGGGSMAFDGSGDYVSMGDVELLDFTDGKFSIICWAYTDSSWTSGDTYPNLVSKGATAGWDTDGWSLYHFRPSEGRVGLGMRNGGTTSVIGWDSNDAAENKDVWQMHSVTVNGSGNTAYVYLNTTQKASSTPSINPASNSTNVYIARDTSRYFYGKVGSVQIYNRQLSASEITQNFNAHRSRFGV